MSARVKDAMTTRVVAVRENARFKDIVALLTEYRVSAFPVLDEQGVVIGVVSEADLLSKEALVAAIGVQVARLGRVNGAPHHDEFVKAAAVTAADLMTKPPVVVSRTSRSRTPPASCTTAGSSGCPWSGSGASWSGSSAAPTC